MPKQIHNIQQFHGGLSSNSDPRDIDDSELSIATDVMVIIAVRIMLAMLIEFRIVLLLIDIVSS